jgi:hypothetical protein
MFTRADGVTEKSKANRKGHKGTRRESSPNPFVILRVLCGFSLSFFSVTP